MKKGILISFEGGEGGGKTTQIAKIKDRLVQDGQDVVSVREPGGSKVGEQIRDLVLSNKYKGISFATEVLLFQAARAEVYHEVVLPALAAGKTVLMDRTRDSSVVYQGMVRKFGRKLIEQLNNISTQNTCPDLTLLLDVPVETGLRRRESDGEMNRLDLEEKNFHELVRKSYLKLAKEDKTGRWVIVDASQPMETVENELWTLITKKLK